MNEETMMTTNVKHDVRAAVQRWLDATMTADADALDALLTPDYTYTHATSARVDEREVWLESFRTGGRIYKGYAIADERYLIYGNVVVLSGSSHQEMSPRGEPVELNTHFISVWLQGADGAWRCSAWQATRIVPPKA